MVSTSKHPNITLFTYSEVVKFTGNPGNYNVKIHKKARYINDSKCTGCGLCITKCPVKVPNEFNRGMGERSAIYIPFPQAVPKIALIDKSVCIECKNCQRLCSAEAIDFDQVSEYIELKVGAVIIATGWDEYPIMKNNDYKYGFYLDVITQIELERMLSPVGPTGGHVCRISDGKVPNTVAMIQCVGSRSLKGNPYCSGVCCNVALKNAQLLKQEYPEMEIVIFYIDMRTWDKRNEEYYRKAREAGIMMIRGKVGDIREDPQIGKIRVTAASTLTDDFIIMNTDLVVLSTGMVPSKGTIEIVESLGIAKDINGFLTEVHGCLKPQETNNLGIYICGCATGPKNIPYSVSTALAAASKASILLSKDIITQELIIAEVAENLCMGCHRCEKLCHYKAISVNGDNIAKVDDLKCKGCGVCVSSCPARAIDLKYYREKQLSEEVKGICSTELEYKKDYIESIELIWKKIEALAPYHT
ncbi:MAG: 4Fe-4S dicluster-binding protein [Promethearchaeota archaeon]